MCECGRHYETPDENAGRLARCAGCGREWIVPNPVPPEDIAPIEWKLDPPVTSGKAIASLTLGVCFFLACLTGVPAIILGRRALGDIDRSGGQLKGRGLATAGITLGAIGCLLTLAALMLMPAIRSASEAARRSQCTNNLKYIGLALWNYHEVNGCLPPAAITDKDGKPLLSWRVAILPYFEYENLYAKFRLDEPWDSPHNIALLDSMPASYACPSDTARLPRTTGYQAVIGPGTAFPPDLKPLRLPDFADGLDNTILVSESRHTVPWTKPEDLRFDMTQPLSGLGSHHGYHNNGFNAVFASGAVQFLKKSTRQNVIGALLTRNGDEVVSPSDY